MLDCVYTKIIYYNDNIINSWYKFATIMDYDDKISDNIFPLYSIIIHGTPMRVINEPPFLSCADFYN